MKSRLKEGYVLELDESNDAKPINTQYGIVSSMLSQSLSGISNTITKSAETTNH